MRAPPVYSIVRTLPAEIDLLIKTGGYTRTEVELEI